MKLEAILKEYVRNPDIINDKEFVEKMAKEYYDETLYTGWWDYEYVPEHPEYAKYHDLFAKLDKVVFDSEKFGELALIDGNMDLVFDDVLTKEFINHTIEV